MTTRTPRVPAAERRRQAEVQARQACSRGHHTMTNTFRPREQVCTVCGLVTYCPACLDMAHLPRPYREHAYPMECAEHRHPQGGQSLSRPMQKWAEMELTPLVKRTPKNKQSMGVGLQMPTESGDPNAD